ncbi:unnamed protein product [Orchesella dallaii]|uniref:Uncharacterized protein n=1 Tax=Orchesella dallaii TaxID=48710 RepID=A0ABP1QT39_9HEXA
MEVSSDAQEIALVASKELLPPESLVQRVDKDLKIIRSKFPVVANVHAVGMWKPGCLVFCHIKKESLDVINNSPYGPISIRDICKDIFTVTFPKPYNPDILSEIIKKEFGLKGEHNRIIAKCSNISLIREGSPTGRNTYIFYKGWGDWPAGAIHKHYWTFTVEPDSNNVELEKEEGSDLSTME